MLSNPFKETAALSAEYERDNAARRAAFFKDCASASVVHTPSGPALLIGKYVVQVSSENPVHVKWLSEALNATHAGEAGL